MTRHICATPGYDPYDRTCPACLATLFHRVAATPARIALSSPLVAGLDAARATAALYVVVHHVALAWDITGPAAVFRHFGHQAVMVFFLLSGFVIFANEQHRVGSDPAGYLWRRVRRIYPLLIAAMAVSAAVAWADGRLAADFTWRSLWATLLAQQDIMAATPGTMADPFLGNAPLWSLSYEIWFYALFPVVVAAWSRFPRAANVGVGVVCAGSYAAYTIHPNHMLIVIGFFAVWWLGAMIADAYGRGARGILTVPVPLLSGLAVCAVAAVPAVLAPGERMLYPIVQVNLLASALLIAVVMFGPAGRLAMRCVAPFGGVARWLASISYGLYVLHYPLLIDWQFARGLGGFCVAVAVLAGLAWGLDRGVARVVRG